jgi:hypothetical protein
MVQSEPWLERDRVMIDHLRTIGITRGQPFTPDPRTQELLEAAVSEARAWLDAGYQAVFRPYYEGGHWALPADPEFRSAFVAYVEWGTRLAVANSQPDATPPPEAPVPRWGWGEAPPYSG